MLKIFSYQDYRTFLIERLEQMPGRGRGEMKRLAEHLRVHPSRISQIFSGLKDFTSEQASQTADFLGLSPNEVDYFILLVEFERAGTPPLKASIKRILQSLKQQPQSLEVPLPGSSSLSEEDKLVLASHWSFSAIRNLVMIPQYQNIDAIASYCGMSRRAVQKVVDFLVKHDLCRIQNGKIVQNQKDIHISMEPALKARAHATWRLKAIERAEGIQEDEFMFSGIFCVSEKKKAEIRRTLMKILDNLGPSISGSRPEKLCCINLDLFELRSNQSIKG